MYAPFSLFPSVSLINKIKFNLLKERNSVAVVLVIQTKRPSVCYVTEIKLSGALNVIKISCKYIEKIPNNINLFIENDEKCSNIL